MSTSKNLLSQKDFKELKNKGEKPVNELAEPFDKGYMITLPVFVDRGLVTKFCKAYQDATQKDLRLTRGDLSIAELIVQWGHDNLFKIENLPAVEIVTGTPQTQPLQGQGQAQVQPSMQAQPPADGTTPQAQAVPPAQPAAQPGAQPAQPAPAPQGAEANKAATDVPANEI